jgi:hypothetical protein
MGNMIIVPSEDVLRDAFLGSLEVRELDLLVEYAALPITEENLKIQLKNSFGEDQGNLLFPQILELSQQVSP